MRKNVLFFAFFIQLISDVKVTTLFKSSVKKYLISLLQPAQCTAPTTFVSAISTARHDLADLKSILSIYHVSSCCMLYTLKRSSLTEINKR